jgi:Domain of unknown function (DUF4160)
LFAVYLQDAGTKSLFRDYYPDVHGGWGAASSAAFHAYYQDDVAVFSLDPIDLIAGSLPRRQQRLVEAWAELHQDELSADWERLQAGEPLLPIEPLERN